MAWCLLLFLGSGDDNRSVYRTVVEGTADPQERLDRTHPGFVTAVSTREQRAARSPDALPDLLARTAGVTVRSIGGLGQFSAVSVRGNGALQTPIFIDGVPVSSGAGGLFNVADIPFDVLDRAEIYRGYVPLTFGSAALGGALNLVGAQGTSGASVDYGVGSYGAQHLQLRVGSPRTELSVGVARARGDFFYFDNAATPYDARDDSNTRRLNNGYERLTLHAAHSQSEGAWTYRIQTLAVTKRQGIPGSQGAQSSMSRLDTQHWRNIARAQWRNPWGPGSRIEVVTGAALEGSHFADPLGEVGLGQDDERTRTLDVYAGPQVRAKIATQTFAAIVADVRFEQLQSASAIASPLASGRATRARQSFGAGVQLEQFFWHEAIQLVPMIRADVADSRFRVTPGDGEVADAGRNNIDQAVSPRLGARLRVANGLELRGSAGMFFRPPNMQELFGDRGFMIGNEGLVPERGVGADLGAVLRFARTAELRAAGFAQDFADLIQWQATGSALRAENVAGARVYGAEAALHIEAPRRSSALDGHYTWLHSANAQNGEPLPGRPQHTLGAHVSAALPQRMGRAFYDLEFVAGNTLDPSGRLRLPPRTLHAAGIEATVPLDTLELTIAFDVRNLTDQRRAEVQPISGVAPVAMPISDYIGYPLPGRSLWCRLSVTTRS